MAAIPNTATVETMSCALCGEREIVVVDKDDYLRWLGGALVQDVWPDKDANWREMMMTGTHGECFDKMVEDL
jgi:hypothetical protein